MIEFTTARDYRGRQDSRIEFREPLKIADSPFDVSIRDVYLGREPVRLYLSGDTIFSGMYLDRARRNELVFPYTAAYDRMFQAGECRRILMIGGAACTYPRHCLLRHPESAVTVVDADPCAEDIARRYFFLDEFLEDTGAGDRLRCVTSDGRAWLESCAGPFDAILNDAFVGAEPVGSLATREALREVRRLLTGRGVYMTNILASITGRAGRFLRAEVKTMLLVFRRVAVFPVTPGAAPDEISNWMLAGSDGELSFPDAVEVRTGREDPVLEDMFLPPAVLGAAAKEL